MQLRPGLGLFLVMAFFGSLFWAHSQDPFRRTEFAVKTSAGETVHGITVLPVGFRNGPVVIYAHGFDGTWLSDGDDLRLFAELGIAAVGFDYTQTNSDRFDSEFSTLLDYVRRQDWANTEAFAWIGFSRGAQNTLSYLLKHPKDRPHLYVRLAGGWISDLDRTTTTPLLFPRTLLVHGENDQVFPVSDAKRLENLLRTNGTPVSLRVLNADGHDFGSDRRTVLRLTAEYCKAILMPNSPLPDLPQLHPRPFFLCILPAFICFGSWLYSRKGRRTATPTSKNASTAALALKKFEAAARAIAVLLGMLATAETALHLIPPQMEISPQTLQIARKHLLAPKWDKDFETLAALPIWKGQQLHTFLTHVELAHYTVNELVNWRTDDAIYRQFVLSPVITGSDYELNWRRELWEYFYPRIRHEQNTPDAALIIVQILRQRVSIADGYPKQSGIESMWNRRIVSPEDFEILSIAALRSAGVPARLNLSHRAEFWTGQTWQSSPRPLAGTWAE